MNLSSLFGGGGYSMSKYFTEQSIPVGSSGTLIDISSLTAKPVRLETLTVDGNVSQQNITIIKDGVPVVSGSTLTGLANKATVNQFSVSQTGKSAFSGSTNSVDAKMLPVISDLVGRNIQVVLDTGTTTQEIYFTYSEG